MTILVADVGGTNCRFALGDAAGLQGLMRLPNDAHDRFESALAAFLAAQGHPALRAACFAVAGPVSKGQAELTNRGWRFDASALSTHLGVQVWLINDLAALGHALPGLAPEGSMPVWDPVATLREDNGQMLVLGLGTGVNICAVQLREGGPPACLEAEAGHQGLPWSVRALLARQTSEDFESCEELFAGRGLARLHAALAGGAMAGDAIVAASAGGDAAARATLGLFATLLGTWAREIALQYLPRKGLFLAGSVARGVVESGFGPDIARAFTAPQRFGDLVQGVPVRLLTDDMAALSGSLAAARDLR